MKIEELLERLSDYNGDLSKDLKNLELSEIEMMIGKMNEIQKDLEKNKKRFEDNPSKVAPKLLTVKEAAEYLRVTTTTIHNLKNSGKIKFRKIGGSIRFTYEDLKVYFFETQFNHAICNESNIHFDKSTSEVVPFVKDKFYEIIKENRGWIYLLNADWFKSGRFSKKEFRKHFRIAEDFEESALKYAII